MKYGVDIPDDQSVSPHVEGEVVAPGESLVAEVTLERFVAGVFPEVISQVAALLEDTVAAFVFALKE